ncbi:hypothetical protein [Campylobacter upsaliensis]|nr:hypothetical protein [Campylobacter upsaliensis]
MISIIYPSGFDTMADGEIDTCWDKIVWCDKCKKMFFIIVVR